MRSFRARAGRRRYGDRNSRPQPRANRSLTDFLFGQFTRDLEVLKEILKKLERRRKELRDQADGELAAEFVFLADLTALHARASLQIALGEFLNRIPLWLHHVEDIMAGELAKGDDARRDRVADLCVRIIDMFCRFCGAVSVVECAGLLDPVPVPRTFFLCPGPDPPGTPGQDSAAGDGSQPGAGYPSSASTGSQKAGCEPTD